VAKIDSYVPGSFCWAELATSDVESAKKFYSEMFGWVPMDLPMPEGSHTIFRADGNDAAAGYLARPGMPPHWGVYFSSSNADETSAKIEQLGGKILAGPFDVMDAGRMAAAQDPQGVRFSVWQAKAHIGATHGGPFGQVMWPELMTPDAGAAANFYTSLFGWKTKPETGLDQVEYIEIQIGGRSMGGIMPINGPQWEGVPPHWGCYVTVADCVERTARAGQLGAKICVAPRDIPHVGKFSVIQDVQGASISLIQLAAMQQQA
jgi:predicted enzyme related to lactoylglutathione lyase